MDRIKHLRHIVPAATLAAVFINNPARACERDPYEFRLPEETEAQAKAREKTTAYEQRLGLRFAREARAFEMASDVYVARVVRQFPSGVVAGKWMPPRATIKPIKALKGTFKPGERELIIEADAGIACEDRGDGYAAYATVGTTVVVFEGLPVSQARPRGIDSLPASDIRTVPLLLVLMDLYGPQLQ